jgi:hypothetical protein
MGWILWAFSKRISGVVPAAVATPDVAPDVGTDSSALWLLWYQYRGAASHVDGE